MPPWRLKGDGGLQHFCDSAWHSRSEVLILRLGGREVQGAWELAGTRGRLLGPPVWVLGSPQAPAQLLPSRLLVQMAEKCFLPKAVSSFSSLPGRRDRAQVSAAGSWAVVPQAGFSQRPLARPLPRKASAAHPANTSHSAVTL